MDSFIVGVREYGLRIDGRTMNEYRSLNINLNRNYGEVEVKVGKTYVLCVVKSELVTPVPDRPSEGFISFSVDAGPLCLNPSTPIYRHNRATIGVEIANYIERMLRETGAIDTEVLCIMSGICSWSVKCEIHVLCDDGNLFDACLLAAVSALRHYKYNGIDVESFLRKIKKNLNERDYFRLEDTIKKMEMIPFNVHHFPLSVTIGYLKFKEELLYIVDPNSDEEHVIETLIHIAVNDKCEICGLNKFGGTKLSHNQLKFAIQLAQIHSEKLHDEFKKVFNKGFVKELTLNSEEKTNISIERTTLDDLEDNRLHSHFNEIKVLSTNEKKIINEFKPINTSKFEDLEDLGTKNEEEKSLESLNVEDEKASFSDGICKTLEKVQLDQVNADSLDLLNAIKTNFKLKKRKKG